MSHLSKLSVSRNWVPITMLFLLIGSTSVSWAEDCGDFSKYISTGCEHGARDRCAGYWSGEGDSTNHLCKWNTGNSKCEPGVPCSTSGTNSKHKP